ncbi:MAG: M1 family metallopeptidase [Ignavibacteriales bacterium]|nr:M1 family metallopeptidase [Ignavibacteriales bacterium]
MMTVKGVTSCLIFLVALTVFTGAQQKTSLDIKTRDYDQVHITLDIALDFEKGQVTGTEYFTFVPLKNGFDTLRLHSIDTEFRSIILGGKKLRFFLRDSLLHVVMPKSITTKDTVTVTIDYTATPTAGLFFFKPGKNNQSTPYQVWSQGQGEDNQHWYPAYDHPDDRLTTEMIVTVPKQFTVISNGEIKEKQPLKNGKVRWHWKMEESHVNYLTAITVGEFEQVTDIVGRTSLDYFMPKDWVQETAEVFGRTPAMLRFFNDYVSPYPYKRYAQTPVYDFLYGGMENVTSTTLNRRLLHTKTAKPNYNSDDLIAHEFAHQWFGDLITCNTWEHAWLNEGFATYFTHLFNEQFYGEDFFKFSMYDTYKGYQKFLKKNSWNDTSAEARSRSPKFRGLWHYGGGASVLHMLRNELGDKLFKKCIKDYVQKYQHSNVITDDLKRSFETSSGRDLTLFFDQWIYGYKYPDLKTSYEYNEQLKNLTLIVQQNDTAKNSSVYSFQLPVHIQLPGARIDTMFQINSRSTAISIKVPAKPELVIFNSRASLICSMSEIFPEHNNLPLVAQVPDITYRLRMVDKLPIHDETIKLLTGMIRNDSSPFVKIRAIERLSGTVHPVVFAAYAEATLDKDARVREATYRNMMPCNTRVSRQFINNYNTETNEYVKASIIFALGRCDSSVPISKLLQFGDIPSHRNIIRRAVMEVAKIRKDYSAMEIAKKWAHYDMSTGDMHQLEESVMEYCEVMADKFPAEVTSIVSAALDNPYFKTRNSALSLAARKKMTSLKKQIEAIAKTDRRKVVRRYVDNAKKELLK